MKTKDILESVLDISKETQTSYYARVAIDLPLPLNYINNDCFYYKIPEELLGEIKVGSVVHVPFGKQDINGFVLDIVSNNDIQSKYKIRPIYSIVYQDRLLHLHLQQNSNFIKLVQWVSKYYLTNIGTVLSGCISTEFYEHYIHEVELITKKIESDINIDKEQRFILDKLLNSKKGKLSYTYLMQRLKFSKQKFYQVITQLKKQGIIKTSTRNIKHSSLITRHSSLVTHHSSLVTRQFSLTSAQQNAYNTILKSITKNEHKSFLLHGVTGSGKTEVYIRLIETVLRTNKPVIYLVPEIYLIPQVLGRLKVRFGESSVLVWHSSLTKHERLTNWEDLNQNTLIPHQKSKIILGARSAILVPLSNIGLIIMDEAHDSSYKQNAPTPRYDAINVSRKRAEIENCPLILGTATPNINDYFSFSQEGTILELPKRIKDYPMPEVKIIDLKNEYRSNSKNIISNILKANILEALNKNEQVILLLNRRGYASHIFCRACGYIQYCKNCSVPLVYHKSNNLMICHHCGYKKSFTDSNISVVLCPECKSPHFKHFGLGTQQLEEEVKKIFPQAKTIRVDSDQLRKKDEYINLWQKFANKEANILIGTQLVAKGIDLQDVTVVGVILADTMLNFPDYLSYERAFQLLTQVTGRAGRGEKPGKVFIQTYQTENKLFTYIKEHDYLGFYKAEIEQRNEHQYPPFTKLIRIIFQSHDEKECLDYANEALKELLTINNNRSALDPLTTDHLPLTTFLGPAPCFFSKLHEKYRYHILCKLKTENTKEYIFSHLFQRLKKSAKVEMIIDIDSLNLL